MPSLITILLQHVCPHCGNFFTIVAVGAGAGADAAVELDAAIDIPASLSAKSLISACCI